MADSPPILDDDPVSPTPREWPRLLLLAALLAAAGVAFYAMRFTHFGHLLRRRDLVHAWVAHHAVLAPLLLLAVYVLLSILMLPVWPVQVTAGYCFGLLMGIVWCDVGAALGAMLSVRLSRWLVGEWFQARYESRMQRLRRIDESLGSNGLAVVLAVRLCHVLPFGLSNYLFGLTRITVLDAGLGTLAGNLPAIAFSVAGGTGAGVLRDWRFWAALFTINLLLLAPLAFRYARGRSSRGGTEITVVESPKPDTISGSGN